MVQQCLRSNILTSNRNTTFLPPSKVRKIRSRLGQTENSAITSRNFPRLMFATCARCLVGEGGVRRHSTSVKSLLSGTKVGSEVTVTGWINNKRKLKNATFLDLTDGSTYHPLQIVARNIPETYCPRALTSDYSATVGSSVRIKGTLSPSRGKQSVELQVDDLTVLGESPETPSVRVDRANADVVISNTVEGDTFC
jgi:OB-fold nucleic acid binding domain